MKNFIALILLFCFCTLSAKQNPKIDSLLTVAKSLQQDTALAEIYIKISREYVYSDIDKASEFAQKALDLSLKINYRKGEGRAKRNFAIIEFYKGNFKKSIELYQGALPICVMAGDCTTVAQLYRAIGISYDRMGQSIKAKAYYADALQRFVTLKDTGGIAGCYNSMAVVYDHYSEYEKALHYFFMSLKLREGRKNEERNVADLYSNIAGVYKRLTNNDKALEYMLKSVSIRKTTADYRGLAISYNSLSGMFMSLGKIDSAEHYVKLALDNAEKVKFMEVIISANTIFGEINAMKKNYPQAYSYFLQSLQLSIKSNDKDSYITALINLADLSIVTGNYADAEKKFSAVVDTALKHGMGAELEKAYSGLANVYNKMGKLNSAYYYLEKAYWLKDSISKLNNTNAMAQQHALFETEKKDKENELLKKETALKDSEIKRQETFSKLLYVIIGLAALFIFAAIWAYKNKQRDNKILLLQKLQIEEQKKDITDSINYAKRIQSAMLPSMEIKEKIFPESFILFLPRDIVSGDFYWFAEKSGKHIIAAVDCTGHGVPGALMSMIGNAFLNEIVNTRGITQPNLILSELRHMIIQSLKQADLQSESRDGMDISIVSRDIKTNTVEYAGANNPVWHFTQENGQHRVNEIAADKRSIGYFKGKGLPFTLQTIEAKKGDTLYLFSDGFADQFGGPKGKKFKYKNMQKIIFDIQHLSMHEQRKKMEEVFNNWKGNLEQIDDVLVIGIKI